MNLRKGKSTSNATEPQRQPPRIVMSVIPIAVVAHPQARCRPALPHIAAFSSLAARNATFLLAAICTVAPVECGLASLVAARHIYRHRGNLFRVIEI
jgi:hypothetical protein